MVLLASLTVWLTQASLQAKSWQGITPLKSTRADVEKLWGKPNKSGYYLFANVSVQISYADQSCVKTTKCYCLVSPDTVLSIYVMPLKEIRLRELGVNKKKLQKAVKGEVLDLTSYYDDREGVSYTIDYRCSCP